MQAAGDGHGLTGPVPKCCRWIKAVISGSDALQLKFDLMRSGFEHYAHPVNTEQLLTFQLCQLFKHYRNGWDNLDFTCHHVGFSKSSGTYSPTSHVGDNLFEHYSGSTCAIAQADGPGPIRVTKLPSYAPVHRGYKTDGEQMDTMASTWCTSSSVSVSQFCISEERDLLIYAEVPPPVLNLIPHLSFYK